MNPTAIFPPSALSFATVGERQKLRCWNTEGLFRLIQSIPSPKAEPFKHWLARVGRKHELGGNFQTVRFQAMNVCA